MQVWRDLRVKQRDLARQHLKGRIQLTCQDTDIFRADCRGNIIAAGKADQVTIAQHQGIKQLVVRALDLFDFPVAAAIKLQQDILMPQPV